MHLSNISSLFMFIYEVKCPNYIETNVLISISSDFIKYKVLCQGFYNNIRISKLTFLYSKTTTNKTVVNASKYFNMEAVKSTIGETIIA